MLERHFILILRTIVLLLICQMKADTCLKVVIKKENRKIKTDRITFMVCISKIYNLKQLLRTVSKPMFGVGYP